MAPAFNADTGKAQVFFEDYKEFFGKEPSHAIAATYAYDGLRLIAEGLSVDGSTSSLRDYLYEAKYDGASGKITFDSNGDVERPFLLKEIRDRQVAVKVSIIE
jgi:ABC-type branched-subunit amino acid transport system substrate-binding protein